jgi:hypothetical protein
MKIMPISFSGSQNQKLCLGQEIITTNINVDYWVTLLFKSAAGIDYKHCVTLR